MSLLLLTLAWVVAAEAPASERAPNIVFILADDLGYGELGCFGQQAIRTPRLDRLAAEGMRFTRHYSGSCVCAPSRCVLMTGQHPGHAVVRDNREARPEGQFPLPAESPTLARLLQQQGYATAAVGKWGLGGPGSSGEPSRQGIDFFFGYNCQRHAHNFYPSYLCRNDQRIPLRNADFAAHQALPATADRHDRANYERYAGPDYAPDLSADEMIGFVRANAARPFFLFFASTIPHLALQAPADAIAQYASQFDDQPYTGDQRYLPQYAPRACYAAMISGLDSYVGRLLDELDRLGLTEQTIVVFSSDNGPAVDGLGGVPTEYFRSAGSLRGRKGSLYEGGVRVPTIARWPGHIPAGATSSRVTGFEDWLPTLLELAGRADRTPAKVDGISMAATLRGEDQPPRECLYREFPAGGGQQAVWFDDWKGVRQELAKLPAGQAPQTELYNLIDDPDETTNLADRYPDVLRRAEMLLSQQHTRSADFPLPGIDRTSEETPP